jgi:hypothetical protein
VREEAPRPDATWTATGQEPPVFFDHRGRRRHWVAGGGGLTVVVAMMWVSGLVGGAIGFTRLPTPLAGLRALPRLVHSIRIDADATHDRSHADTVDIDTPRHARTTAVFVIEAQRRPRSPWRHEPTVDQGHRLART